MNSKRKLLAVAIATAPLWHLAAEAQDVTKPEVNPTIEEVVVTARLKSAAEDVVLERMDHEAVTDILSSELTARIGDSTVAPALRRVPGGTLADHQVIYRRRPAER